MKDKIKRTHFARYRHAFNKGGIIKTNSLQEISPTPERIIERVSRIPWNWINKKIYDPDILQNRIIKQQMRLFDLVDGGDDDNADTGDAANIGTGNNHEKVGYVIAFHPAIDIRRSFLILRFFL